MEIQQCKSGVSGVGDRGKGERRGVRRRGGVWAEEGISPLIDVLGGAGKGGGATPLLTGLDGVLNIRSVKENVPLSNVSSLKRLSSFQAAVSSSSKRPANIANISITCKSTSYRSWPKSKSSWGQDCGRGWMPKACSSCSTRAVTRAGKVWYTC